MSMFGDGRKQDLYDDINRFFEEGGKTEELFEVLECVFKYGTTPHDILQERVDKTISVLSDGIKFCERDSQGEYDVCNMAIARDKKALAILKGED